MRSAVLFLSVIGAILVYLQSVKRQQTPLHMTTPLPLYNKGGTLTDVPGSGSHDVANTSGPSVWPSVFTFRSETSCKYVLATAIFGGYDDLHQPLARMSAATCCFAFVDSCTLHSLSASCVNGLCRKGLFALILVNTSDFKLKDHPKAATMMSRTIKLNLWRLFPGGTAVLWVDGKRQWQRRTIEQAESTLLAGTSVAVMKHPRSHSLKTEINLIRTKANMTAVQNQVSRYREAGLPPDHIIPDSSVYIMRPQDTDTKLFFELWYSELLNGCTRDQIAFPYVEWKLRERLNHRVKIFPISTLWTRRPGHKGSPSCFPVR